MTNTDGLQMLKALDKVVKFKGIDIDEYKESCILLFPLNLPYLILLLRNIHILMTTYQQNLTKPKARYVI